MSSKEKNILKKISEIDKHLKSNKVSLTRFIEESESKERSICNSNEEIEDYKEIKETIMNADLSFEQKSLAYQPVRIRSNEITKR